MPKTAMKTQAAPAAEMPHQTPSLSDAEFDARLTEIMRRKDDPENIAYVKRLQEGAEEARRQINDEARRRLDQQEDK